VALQTPPRRRSVVSEIQSNKKLYLSADIRTGCLAEIRILNVRCGTRVAIRNWTEVEQVERAEEVRLEAQESVFTQR
jgi:hypothetical protein